MVRRINISLVLMLMVMGLSAQGKYKVTESLVTFFSRAPLEDITAQNDGMTGIVDFEGKQFFMKIPIIKFDFPNDLMEEHFNENYLETEDYPDATYKGTFTETVDPSDDGKTLLQTSGVLEIHGVEQPTDLNIELAISDGVVRTKSEFTVRLEDHKVKVPKLIFVNIAEEVLVNVDCQFEPL